MSWQPSHRFSTIHKAILLASLSFSTQAFAVTLGTANVQSSQHEPLQASVAITGIDSENFSVSIADSSIYQQMGLSSDANILVKFVPTGKTSGQIKLSSTAPINKPFTDVVFAIDNNGQEHLKPQTILMPLPKAKTTTPVVSANQSAPELPIVSSQNSVVLDIQDSAPPPLFENTPPIVPQQSADTPNFNAQNTPATQGNSNAWVFDDEDDVHAAQHSENFTNTTDYSNTSNDAADSEIQVLSSMHVDGVNEQLVILTKRITRHILAEGETIPVPNLTPSEDSHGDYNESDAYVADINATDANEYSAHDSTEDTNNHVQDDSNTSSGAVYVVQSGDNLWSIANQIAKVNQLSVNDVMHAIHAQNPNAFNNNNINQLKVNASLNIPNYEFIPSQKAISEAIGSNNIESKDAPQMQAKSKETVSKKSAAKTAAKARPVAKPLPKAQVTLITPNQSGSAVGTQTRVQPSTSKIKTGGALVDTLKQTRQGTIKNARKVNNLQEQLTGATQKLQLQNQKLAELEARLKALKNKNN